MTSQKTSLRQSRQSLSRLSVVLSWSRTEITSIILEEELKTIIVKNHLKESFSKNLVGYFRMMFRFAYRSRLVKTNEFDFVDTDIILAFAEDNKVKAEEEQVLTADELGKLVTATRHHEIKHPNYMPDYAIELASLTGMRAGELSVLRWTDIDVKHGYIHIDYSEHRIDYEDHSELVIDEPKCLKHRKFPIGDAIRDLFERIRSLGIDSEYVFGKPGGGRYTGHDISCACGRRAKEAGVGRTSIYRIRKTVVSEMRKHYPAKLVSNLVGHLEETDECYYNFDNSEAYEKLEAVNSYASVIIPFNREKPRKIRSSI